MKTTFKKTLFSATCLATGAMLAASPAYAQDTTAQGAEEAPADAGSTIIVTGSLIRNPSLTSTSPVTAVSTEEVELRQTTAAEEVIRDIPGTVPSIGSNVNNGNGGSSYVNLRGLGEQRNIVLLDGNRIVPAGLGGLVDLNNIPLALIQRTEVLTGGASSTYGADAISGVVNFITKQDFAGMEALITEGITERGDGNRLRADVTLGANFDDGRGNAVLSIGYQEVDPVFFGADRPRSQVTLESYDATFVAGQGSSTTAPSALDIGGGRPRQQVSADGTTIQPFYRAYNFNPFNVFQVPFRRYNAFAQAHYDVSDKVTVYSRALYSNNTVDTVIAPSGVFGSSVTVPVSNPFLTTAQRNYLCANADTNTAVAGNQTLTAAQCAAAQLATSPTDPNYRTFTFGLRRRTPEVGPRISSYNSQVFDFRVGSRYNFSDHLSLDVSGSYGESKKLQTIKGYVLLSRVRQALLATNTTSCLNTANNCVPLNIFGPQGSIDAKQVDFINDNSTTAVNTSLAQARALLSGDVGITSPFASSPISFAIGTEYRKYKAEQASDALSKTAGELGGAGGAAPDINGGYDVYEGYAEVLAPLVSDRPFFHNLQLEAGIRRSHYKVFTPTSPTFNTTTWKVGGEWAPVPEFKFRGNYQHAVRAPTISELFSPISTGLTNLGTDPCSGSAPTTNANLRAVCIAQGAPAATIGFITNPTAGQANVTGGGNLNLQPEVANTYTVGAVFTPTTFLRGFSASVDYYNIKIKKAITTPTPADLIAACFGASPTSPPASAATDPNCTVIRRNPITGGLDGDPATTGGLFGVLSNLGNLYTDGVDVYLGYRTNLGNWGDDPLKLAFEFNGNYTAHSKFQATPTSINRECVGYYSVNCLSIQPKYSFSARTTLGVGPMDISLLWRYIDKVQLEPQQLADDIAAATAAGAGCPNFTTDAGDAIANGGGACLIDTAFRNIKSYNYFDLTMRWAVTDNFTFIFGVQNLFDKQPPTVGGTVGSTTYNGGNTYPSTYDGLGRRYSASAKITF